MKNPAIPLLGRGIEYTGALIGGSLGTATGDPLAGMALGAMGATIGGLVADTAERQLSARERRRTESVANHAAAFIKEFLADRWEVRSDGFFESASVGDNTAAEEIVEGVLRAAQASFEERKVEHLGHLMAVSAFDQGMDAGTLHWALTLAGELTWNQYLLLAAFDQDRSLSKPPGGIREGVAAWDAWSMHDQLSDLRYQRHLIAAPAAQTKSLNLPYTNNEIQDHVLTVGGGLLNHLLGLRRISDREAIEVLKILGSDAGSTAEPGAAGDSDRGQIQDEGNL